MKKNKLWGGRFSKPTHKLVEEFTGSIHFDQKLAKYDCIGSLAHIEVLKKAKLLTIAEHSALKKALNAILKTIEKGTFKIDPSFEDIHSYIQHLVDQKAGKAGLKLHTCRSRNDQVAVATRLYVNQTAFNTFALITRLQTVLKKIADDNRNAYVPGFTHLQHAIPVSLSDQFMSYHEMLDRDTGRLVRFMVNEIPMGAGALAGTLIEAKNYQNQVQLPKAFKETFIPSKNALDSVSDRDFVIEALSALALLQMHLSRLAEDMILWSTKEFDFIDIDDAFCTGSSLMPQKKNPDVLELVRGYTGRLNGNLINVLTMMKGLPLSYNRDMQLDKEPLFDSFEIVQKELVVLAELFKNVKFKKDKIAKQLEDESLYATDIADHLVQNGVAFKDAHKIVGELIQYKYKSNENLKDMSDAELKKFHSKLNAKIIKQIINPKTSVESKKSIRRK